MAGANIIIWGLVGVGLFVAAAGAVVFSKAFDALGKRLGVDGWRICALWTRRLAGALTLLLITGVLTATLLLILRAL